MAAPRADATSIAQIVPARTTPAPARKRIPGSSSSSDRPAIAPTIACDSSQQNARVAAVRTIPNTMPAPKNVRAAAA